MNKKSKNNLFNYLETNEINKGIIEKSKKSLLILKALKYEPFNKEMLKSICFKDFNGINSNLKGFRSLIWKILLNYFPENINTWEKYSLKNKLSYDSFLNKFFPTKGIEENENFANSKYEFDLILWERIERDTNRTGKENPFFSEKITKNDCLKNFCFNNKDNKNNQEMHINVLTRILYLFAKFNSSLII